MLPILVPAALPALETLLRVAVVFPSESSDTWYCSLTVLPAKILTWSPSFQRTLPDSSREVFVSPPKSSSIVAVKTLDSSRAVITGLTSSNSAWQPVMARIAKRLFINAFFIITLQYYRSPSVSPTTSVSDSLSQITLCVSSRITSQTGGVYNRMYAPSLDKLLVILLTISYFLPLKGMKKNLFCQVLTACKC